MDRPACYRLSPSGLSLFVRVTPNAGRDAIEGVEQRDDGSAVLRVRVKAVPDKGKANAAVVALLAKALGVSKSAVSVVSGATARLKTLAVMGDSAALIKALGNIPS
ncbi:hypothetical protein FF80_01565 [Devosia sp. LC5]|uniref:DUF167 family protein n=1 Tax=Devosia sp. LC5 TaxID=1502724 RepID=UPI0004E30DAF|nr:DUF167 family protein [Devosia sp. LC5]KFC68612.1 hypothetical protein FF80_01565 [Devosia sp. LC5]